MADPSPTVIGVALVASGERVLVGTRGPEGPLAGLAEFPGGKCEPGESPAECAVRECREETGLEVEVVELLAETVWQYPHGTVHLHFFLCRPVPSAGTADRPGGFCWRPLSELPSLPFPAANRVAIDRLLHRTMV